MRVLVFGDSIVYGAWDSQGGWAERLKRDAHRLTLDTEGQTKRQVINLGIGGDTSTKILARMEQEIIARQSANWPLVLVFSFGANDERTINGEVETSPDVFLQNCKDIIKLAKKYTSKIFFINTPPLSHATLDFKGQEYSQARILEYQDALNQLLDTEGITYVTLPDALPEDAYSYDGLHPNDMGHQLIYERVAPELEKLIA